MLISRPYYLKHTTFPNQGRDINKSVNREYRLPTSNLHFAVEKLELSVAKFGGNKAVSGLTDAKTVNVCKIEKEFTSANHFHAFIIN